MKLNFVFSFIFLITTNLIVVAQKGLSFTIYGMPQRTFMYNKPEGDNSVEVAIEPYPSTTIENLEIKRDFNS